MKSQRLILFSLVTLGMLWGLPATADWSVDTTENNPVCTAMDYQDDPELVSDGAGGAIIVWIDKRTYSTTEYDIYVQRLDASGTPLWTAQGAAVCTFAARQADPALVEDGAGGAIIVWRDSRSGSYDIYAQRVDAAGNMLWTTDGVALCSAANNQQYPELTSDGYGGAIVVWHDYRSGADYKVYAQRVDASGSILWGADGTLVCTAANSQWRPRLDGDGAGGAIIAWYDWRNGIAVNDIYAQRMDPSGNPLWTTGGMAICTASNTQDYPWVVSDGAGGAIITWEDHRLGPEDIFAQRVDGSGNVLWTADGVEICTAADDQQLAKLVTDGSGGAIITWEDERTGEKDVYARRIDSTGTALWADNGIAVCSAAGDQFTPRLAVDGSGGAIITWQDRRLSDTSRIYAQRVDGSGNALWAGDGIAICSAPSYRWVPYPISDGAGGAIIAWEDARNVFFTQYDIYAQRIGPHGYPGGDHSPMVTEVIDYPDDQGGAVVLSWSPCDLDQAPQQLVTHYAVSRRQPPSPVWEHVEDVTALYWDEYASNAPTYEIYGGGGEIPWTEYKVVAHTVDPLVFWESAVASGYSVDNLAPGAPLNLAATASGTDVLLTWSASGHHDEDLALYRIYRSDVQGFTPGLANQIGTSATTSHIDPAPGENTWYYLVSGEDINGNEGLPSNEASATMGSSGMFTSPEDYPAGNSSRCVAIGDLDDDGVNDLAVANYSSDDISVLPGLGDGTFSTATGYPVGSSPASVAIGDLDTDGVLDLVSANLWDDSVAVLLGNGDGSFAAAQFFTTAGAPYSVVVADLNGDTLPDVSVTNSASSSVSVLLGIGDGTLAPAVSYPVGTEPLDMAADDLDGDSIPDLAVTNKSSNSVSVLLGLGDGTFSAAVDYAAGARPHGLAIGDMDGDAIPDLVTADSGADAVSVLPGLGDGTFAAADHHAVGAFPTSVRIVDLNGDMMPDLAVTNFNADTITILTGTGNGSLVADADYPVGDEPAWVASGVLDDNDSPDLAVANNGDGDVSVLLNLNVFSSPTISATYSCTPSSGTVPFTTTMSAQMTNLETTRPATRIAARIDVVLANGTSYNNWRRGYTNVSQGSSYGMNWGQTFPAIGSVIGSNIFTMIAEDITPSPYNQPPYPGAGDTATDVCTVTANAP